MISAAGAGVERAGVVSAGWASSKFGCAGVLVGVGGTAVGSTRESSSLARLLPRSSGIAFWSTKTGGIPCAA